MYVQYLSCHNKNVSKAKSKTSQRFLLEKKKSSIMIHHTLSIVIVFAIFLTVCSRGATASFANFQHTGSKPLISLRRLNILRQPIQHPISTKEIESSLSIANAGGDTFSVERERLLKNVLEMSRAAGQVGSKCDESVLNELNDAAKSLVPYSDQEPGRIPLVGNHVLIHSQVKFNLIDRLSVAII